MKTADLVRHLESHGCVFVRHGANHDVYANPATRAMSTVPRHRETKEGTARAICRQLGVPSP